MRRKRIRHLLMPPAVILILMMSFITACEADFLNNSENQKFSLQQAKEYSLQNSTNFKMPSSVPLSKSTTGGVEYEPLWEEAKYHEIRFPDKIARTYEVPLKIDAGIGGILLKNGNHASEAAKMSSSLVVQEFEQGDTRTRRQIMATIVGNDSGGNTSSAAFSYMGSRETFTGFMIVSTVSGKILNIFQYINGERTVMYLKTDDSESTAGYYRGIRFVKTHITKAAGESTIPGVCYMCGKTGDVYPDYGHICAECLDGSEFLDDIIVTPDLPPGGGGGNECLCGDGCNCLNNGSLICACTQEDNPGTGCSYCGVPGCNGECRNGSVGSGNGNSSADGEWWPGGHAYITREALNQYLTSDQIASINRGHISADGKQEIENAHIHAMLQPGQTYAEGVNKMKNHFTDYVMSFLSQNDYEALGEALHCIQDAYSPPHAMQEWNGMA